MAKKEKKADVLGRGLKFDDLRAFDETPYAIRFHAVDRDGGRLVDLEKLTSASTHEEIGEAEKFVTQLGAITTHPNLGSVLGCTQMGGDQLVIINEVTEGNIFEVEGIGSAGFDLKVSFVIIFGGALASLHNSNVVHGDLRPTVFRMSQFGQPLLTGFGYAIQRSCRNLDDPAITSYTAPELLGGAGRTVSSDLYGFAAFCVHLLTGTPLYEVVGIAGSAGLASKIVSGRLPNLKRLGIPEVLVAPLTTALSKHPAERIVDVRELVTAFSDFEATLGKGTTRVPLPGMLVIDAAKEELPQPSPPELLPREVFIDEVSIAYPSSPPHQLGLAIVTPTPAPAVVAHEPSLSVGKATFITEPQIESVFIETTVSVSGSGVALPPPGWIEPPSESRFWCMNGHEIQSSERFCPTCGTSLSPTVQQDVGPTSEGSVSCSKGHSNRVNAKFCKTCGCDIHPAPLPRILVQPPISPLTELSVSDVHACPAGHINDLETNFCLVCGREISGTLSIQPIPITTTDSSHPSVVSCVNGHLNSATEVSCSTCGMPLSTRAIRLPSPPLTATCARGHDLPINSPECLQCKQAFAQPEEGVVIIFREEF